ncbi:inactivation-no-after-potential D protein [Microplitis demolitor]|uniref:inactivation-no-after-potential D protein n=1 Tax=Microplitis demolitor TaxID=69319 RepID=UPI0006D4C695|nr:inactivation-no-after-potential D protein [Microplitis demolitor]
MTITHQETKGGSPLFSDHWGPEKHVELHKPYGGSLGFSIVAGKIEINSENASPPEQLCGIFIKNVEPNSPAGNSKQLSTGDRILAVNDVDLHNTTYEDAVDIIKNSGDTLRLVIQSFIQSDNTVNKNPSVSRHSVRRSIKILDKSKSITKSQSVEDSAAASSNNDEETKAERKKYSSDSDTESEEDERQLEGNVLTAAGKEISRKSAANLKKTATDPDEEDDFGYTMMKVNKKYKNLGKNLLLVRLEKQGRDYGIAIAGHKDRKKMSTFICGLNPKGAAIKTGQFQVGDEIIEVNGQVLKGRCHLNAVVVIRKLLDTTLTIVLYRSPKQNDQVAIDEVHQFPPTLEESELYSQYEGVHTVVVKKGTYGMGIMIIQGKHAELGQGIFVSDIQEGSAAEAAGLQVGDLLLGVNSDTLLDTKQDEATNMLKQCEGLVTLIVCSPKGKEKAQSTIQEIPGTDNKAGAVAGPEGEKPKPVEPPKPAKKQMTIEFTKTNDKPLGFTIVGGNDTPLVAIFVLDINSDTPIGTTDHLQRGDQILEVGADKFNNVDNHKATLTIIGATGTVKMVIYRDEKYIEEFEVELQKKAGKPLGLYLKGYKDGKGAYISEILPGGIALESGKLTYGDRIIGVCGDDVKEKPVEEIVILIKIANPVKLKLARYKVNK